MFRRTLSCIRLETPRLAFVALAVCLGPMQPAIGQDYPERPITMIVPLAAGGGTDIIARIVAERMKATLGQPVVVENVPKAAGTIGVGRAAQAAPDGYTIVVGDQTSFVVSSMTYPVRYDVRKDFEPVSLLSTSSVALVAKAAMVPRDFKELIAWLRANPDLATSATFGKGSGPHVVGFAFQNRTGTRLRPVPYRGAALALQDVVSGQVDLMFVEASSMMGHVRGGRVKAYVTLSKTRSAALPQVPTIEEAGGPPLYITTWRGLWVPRGTPKHISERLNAAIVEALSDPAVVKRVATAGQEIVPQSRQSPAALASHHQAEIENWTPLIKAATAAK